VLKFRTKEGRAASRPTNYLGHKFQRPWILGLFVLAGGIWLLRGGEPGRLGNVFQTKPNQVALVDETRPDGKPMDNVVPKGEIGVVRGERPANPVEGKRLFHNVDPKLFTKLEDDVVYRAAENPSLFQLLKTLQDADQRDIQLASKGVRVYRQLSEQSNEYRGEIVTVVGVVQSVVPSKKQENPQGIEKFYEVWIVAEGGTLPIVVVVPDMPAGFPSDGKQIGQRVSATGFFYKRLGYLGDDPKTKKDQFRSSPMVLAKQLTWTPKAADLAQARDEAVEHVPGLPKGLPVEWVMPLLGIGIVVMIVLAVWSFRLSRSSFVDRGPIVGRLRREAEEARNPVNLNQLEIDP